MTPAAARNSFVVSLLPFTLGVVLGFMAAVATFSSRVSVLETKIDLIQETLKDRAATERRATPSRAPTSAQAIHG